MTKTIPTIPPTATTLAAELLELAGDLQEFCNAFTESLSFDDYGNLCFWEAKLLAYGNLLSTKRKVAYLESELKEARDILEYTRQRRS